MNSPSFYPFSTSKFRVVANGGDPRTAKRDRELYRRKQAVELSNKGGVYARRSKMETQFLDEDSEYVKIPREKYKRLKTAVKR